MAQISDSEHASNGLGALVSCERKGVPTERVRNVSLTIHQTCAISHNSYGNKKHDIVQSLSKSDRRVLLGISYSL